MNNIPESVRQKIKETVDEAVRDSDKLIPHELLHLITQISFEMFKSGWKEAHRAMKITIEVSEKAMVE
jgi:hypothetical protein